MSEPVKLKSKDGRSTCECPEKYAVALVASGKWIRVEPQSTPPPKSGTMTYYVMGPYENNDRYSICRDDPAGGDPLIIVTIARIHRQDELYQICELANKQIEASRPAHPGKTP